MNNEKNIEIAEMYRNGHSFVDIAKKYGFTRQRAQQIAKQILTKQEMKAIKHKKMTATAIRNEMKKDPIVEARKAIRRLVVSGKRWSIHSESCLGCGSTELPHSQNGYCRNCAYSNLLSVRIARKKATNKYNEKNPEKKRIRDKRNNAAFRERLKKDPEKMKAYNEKNYKRIKEKFGSIESFRQFNRDRAKHYYKKIERLIYAESLIRKINKNFRFPELEKRRQRVRDRYANNKEIFKERARLNYLKRKEAKISQKTLRATKTIC